MEYSILRVSSVTNPTGLAGAIAGTIREHGKVEVTCVGAAAVNQAVKAIAIARGYVAPNGIDIMCVPGFMEADDDRTGIRFVVMTR